MKLKLTQHEVYALYLELRTFNFWLDATEYEKDITRSVIRKLMVKIMKKLMDRPEKMTLDLDETTMRALVFTLDRMMPENEFNQCIIWEISSKIKQELVNIS